MRIPSFRFFHSIKYFPQNIFNFLSLTCSLLSTRVPLLFRNYLKETRAIRASENFCIIRLKIWHSNHPRLLCLIIRAPEKYSNALENILLSKVKLLKPNKSLIWAFLSCFYVYLPREDCCIGGERGGDLSLEFVFCWRSGDCCQHQASLVRPALINTTIVSLPQ